MSLYLMRIGRLNEEIRDVDFLLSDARKLAMQYPKDESLTLSINQLEHRKKVLLKEREEPKYNHENY